MLRYCTDSLIHSAKMRGRIPDSSFTPEELLQIATEELETYLFPLIVSVQEDYYLRNQTFTLTADSGATTIPVVEYRIPPRALGNALKDVLFVDTQGRPVDVPRIAVTDLEQSAWGVIIEGQSITYLNRQNRSDITSMIMKFVLTPSPLCQVAQAATVASIVGHVVTLAAAGSPTWELDEPAEGPAPLSFNGQTSFDLVKATPGFEVIAFDQAGTCDGSAVTLTGTVPTNLAVGDYVSLAATSPVPQCPVVMWGLLAQSIAAALLEENGDADGHEKALAKRKLMEDSVLPLIQNRVRGAPRSITPRNNFFRAGARW